MSELQWKGGSEADLIELDGISFLKVREHNTELFSIPTYLFSADGNINVVADKLHATGYLSKPVDLGDIYATADKHMKAAIA